VGGNRGPPEGERCQDDHNGPERNVPAGLIDEDATERDENNAEADGKDESLDAGECARPKPVTGWVLASSGGKERGDGDVAGHE